MGVFADISAGLPGVNVGSASWGDYDNDGDLDILLTGWTDSDPYDFIRGCTATMTASLPTSAPACQGWRLVLRPGGITTTTATWTSCSPAGRVQIQILSRVYRNDDGVFSNITAGLPGVEVGSAAWGDYDNDGDLDILLTGSDPLVFAVYRNDDGVFADISAGLPGVSDSSAAWGDYDNDGDLDILLTGRTGSDPDRISRVYRNDDGVFADISAGLPGVSDSSASWGDYDNDGDLDILLTGRTGSDPDRIPRVYRNDDGVFADISAGLPGVAFGSASWGDYDNDGDLDILLTGGTGSDPARIPRVYRNDDGVFTNITAGLPGVDSSAAWGDYDNDGDLDILLTGYTGSDPDRIARVYRNDDCADLAVSKRVVVPTGAGEAVTAAPGEPLTYTLAFANLGEAPAEGVVLTDSLPLGEVTGLGYTVSSGLSVTLRAGTTYIWDVEDLPVGEGGTITITGVIKVPSVWFGVYQHGYHLHIL